MRNTRPEQSRAEQSRAGGRIVQGRGLAEQRRQAEEARHAHGPVEHGHTLQHPKLQDRARRARAPHRGATAKLQVQASEGTGRGVGRHLPTHFAAAERLAAKPVAKPPNEDSPHSQPRNESIVSVT